MMTARRPRPTIFAVLVLAAWSIVLSQPMHARADEPARLKLATYNVLNLFDVFDDPYTTDEETRVKPRDQINAVAQAIRAINPDVIAFQEVENAGALRAMFDEELGDLRFRYIVAGESNNTRGIRVAVASRLPIRRIISHRFTTLRLPDETRTWDFARDLMQVEVEVTQDSAPGANDAQILDLFIVHFKSKRDGTDDPNSNKWRLAEALGARKILNDAAAANPSRWQAIVGDFNDTGESPVIGAFTSPTAQAPGHKLIDVHAKLPAAEAYSYIPEQYRSKIDFMLVNTAMRRALDEASPAVLHDRELTFGSDHAPISATFQIPPKP